MSGRSVIIFGASGGIGGAIARRLLADATDRVAHVIGVGRRIDAMPAATSRFVRVALDVTDAPALDAKLAELAADPAEIDAVVWAAGAGTFGGLEQLAAHRVRAAFDVHLLAPTLIARALLPAMKRRGRGDFVLIGSEAATAGGRQGAVYSAAKFGLRGLAESLRDECARSGVRISSINPGMVRTAFFDELAFAPGDAPENAIEPEDVADAVALVLHMRAGTVVDRIDLSPLKKVVQKKPR